MSAPRLSEDEWTTRVMQTARLHSWRAAHFRPARTAKGWRTPMTGDVGVPDLILARDGVVLLAELKGDRGTVRPDQRLWLDALGRHGRLWRPRDWDDVLATLSARRATGDPGAA